VSRGENVDLYLTAAVAMSVALLDLTNLVSGQQPAGVTLAVLALMSVNMLTTRIKLGSFMDDHHDQQVPHLAARHDSPVPTMDR
jgi:hypothetical protein